MRQSWKVFDVLHTLTHLPFDRIFNWCKQAYCFQLYTILENKDININYQTRTMSLLSWLPKYKNPLKSSPQADFSLHYHGNLWIFDFIMQLYICWQNIPLSCGYYLIKHSLFCTAFKYSTQFQIVVHACLYTEKSCNAII